MRSIVLHSIRFKLQRLNTIYNIEDDEVVRYDDNGAGDEDWRMTGAESSGRKPECVAGGGSRPEPTTPPAPEHIRTRESMYEPAPDGFARGVHQFALLTCTRTYLHLVYVHQHTKTNQCIMSMHAMVYKVRRPGVCKYAPQDKKYGFPHFLGTQVNRDVLH